MYVQFQSGTREKIRDLHYSLLCNLYNVCLSVGICYQAAANRFQHSSYVKCIVNVYSINIHFVINLLVMNNTHCNYEVLARVNAHRIQVRGTAHKTISCAYE